MLLVISRPSANVQLARLLSARLLFAPPFARVRRLSTGCMLAKVNSAALYGIDALRVEVEIDLASGLPQLATVGLPEGAVKESKDRIRAAVKNCGYTLPAKRITINLAPADIKKEGSAYDLPMAVGILAAEGLIQKNLLDDYFLIGELSLDGSVKPVRGALPIAMAAKKEKYKGLILPDTNASEAAVVRAFPSGKNLIQLTSTEFKLLVELASKGEGSKHERSF